MKRTFQDELKEKSVELAEEIKKNSEIGELVDERLKVMKPVPTLIYCPNCKRQHFDRNEWMTKPHRTHLCEHCKHTWRPYEVPTVGLSIRQLTEICNKL